MAMPPRLPRRRAASQRWLLVPLALTLLVVLADAAMHARSNSAAVALSADQWVDRALPHIADSSAEGLEVAKVSSGRLTDGPAVAVEELSRVASQARGTYRFIADLTPPNSLLAEAGLLDACLASRENGAQQVAAAAALVLDRGKGSAREAVDRLMGAAQDFQVSDSAYEIFARDMPKAGFTVPRSAWASPSYNDKAFTTFTLRLAVGGKRLPRHQLAIDAITTFPGALSVQGKVQVLPPASTLSVTVVVADSGALAERGVTVKASVSPSSRTGPRWRSATVDVEPGLARSVVLTGLAMELSTPTTLAVTVTPARGVAGEAAKSISIEMAGPNFDQSTTTRPARRTKT